MKRGHVPVSPIALGIGVVVLVLAAFSPGQADVTGGDQPGGSGSRTSISVR